MEEEEEGIAGSTAVVVPKLSSSSEHMSSFMALTDTRLAAVDRGVGGVDLGEEE